MSSRRVHYHPVSSLRAPLFSAKPWVPTMAIWTVGVGAAALYMLSVTPLVKREVLRYTPALGWYFDDTTPPSDKPF